MFAEAIEVCLQLIHTFKRICEFEVIFVRELKNPILQKQNQKKGIWSIKWIKYFVRWSSKKWAEKMFQFSNNEKLHSNVL